MQYTEGLNLKKPDVSDFYDVNNFNDNMDVLDKEICGEGWQTDGLELSDLVSVIEPKYKIKNGAIFFTGVVFANSNSSITLPVALNDTYVKYFPIIVSTSSGNYLKLLKAQVLDSRSGGDGKTLTFTVYSIDNSPVIEESDGVSFYLNNISLLIS